MDVPDIPPAEVVDLVKKHPKGRFILLNAAGLNGTPLGRAGELPTNYVIEISRASAVLGNEIGQLLAALGPDRLVFGSGMPFTYPDPALLKLEVLEAPQDVKEQIRWRNAAALFADPK